VHQFKILDFALKFFEVVNFIVFFNMEWLLGESIFIFKKSSLIISSPDVAEKSLRIKNTFRVNLLFFKNSGIDEKAFS